MKLAIQPRRPDNSTQPVKSQTSQTGLSPVLERLQQLHRTHAPIHDGKVATYIPELAKADPDTFGICLVTASGHIYEVGDSQTPFTIQSISKPFVYGLALEDNTRPDVLQKVGVEPSGDVFNAISLEPGTGRPRNPMINAGAIATTGLIAGKSLRTRQRRMLEMFSLHAGRELAIDDAVYRSESETGHRNRAIGHMLRNFDILTEDPTPVVELYFKQCAVSVTCRDLGIMAATLANGGKNPVTGKQAIRGEYVESVLSVMASSGMYDFAGEWIYRVGMPAKSGVSGGVIAVLPGQFGVGVFSPRLDEHGNSVRGIRVCNDLSRVFNLHLFNTAHLGQSPIRLKFNGAQVNSSRVRTPAEAALLHHHGHCIQTRQLQGNLVFSTAEAVVHDVMEILEATDFLVLDLKHVPAIDESACRLFAELLTRFDSLEKRIIFTHLAHLPRLARYLKTRFGANFEKHFRKFDDSHLALEWCENQLMHSLSPAWQTVRSATIENYELFAGLSQKELATVASVLQRKRYRQGETIVQAGDDATELFLLANGLVSVTVAMNNHTHRRIATFSAGMVFGEMALIDQAPRSAHVSADTDVACDLLSMADFNQLGETNPRIKIVMLQNLALGLCQKLRKTNREISVFDS
ncbi:MAG: glutaminase A [Verrucomicrobia bacterium]|nr:glutaminase A [Verrucomicrobiota bacterium]